jgi:rhodanese-related sulfurtransferase
MKNKIVKISITAAILFFTLIGFSQNKSANTVSLEVYYNKIQAEKSPQIIDARGPEEFALNHIKGAVNFNLESKDYAQQIAKLDKTRPVFTYSIGAREKRLAGTRFTKKRFQGSLQFRRWNCPTGLGTENLFMRIQKAS